MQLNQLPTEQIALLDAIDPDENSAATYTTAWMPAKNFSTFMAVVLAGAMGSSGTIDAKLEQATDASGTGAKDISGKAITQLTEAGTDSDKQAIINLKVDELDAENNFDHIRLSITVATAASDSAGLLFGVGPYNAPASDYDAATVDEIV